MADKVKITIDGVEKEVDAGKNLLQAILDDGQLLPHFCYHEALGSAGACRLCACMISPAADKPGRLDMACMVRVSEGMVVKVNEEYATKFRKTVLEDLMLNHPHDCPVCDEGGECMLQDMTVLTQQQHRRNRFPKRTWKNQYLGPFVHHEMNRCITCYRCVRYYKDYALGDDLGVYGSRDRVYFGRVEDGNLESEFAGNLVDVCPTGVFTDKVFRESYTRPWDLQTARSVCVNCSVGCNVLPGYRNNSLRRIKPAENAAVNKFFICDRGRYGAEFVNDPSRLMSARIGGEDASFTDAFDFAAAKLKSISEKHGSSAIAGFGSAKSSMEANAALALLLKGLGSSRIAWHQTKNGRATIRRAASITASGEITVPSLKEIESSDYVLILGGDLTTEAPMIDLAVRQAVRAGAKLFIASPRAGKLDQFATASWRTVPGEEANIASFVSSMPGDTEVQEDNFVQKAGVALQASKKPLIIASALHEDTALVETAFNMAKTSTSNSSRTCRLAYCFPDSNSVGIGLTRADENPESIWADIQGGRIKALVVLENDLATQFRSTEEFEKAVSNCEFVLLIDSLDSTTASQAHVVIPCVSHYQSFGTFLNYEGRGQRFDGMHFSSPVNLAASEVLVSLIQRGGLENSIGGTEFHDVYDVTRETSRMLDNINTGDNGTIIRTSPKLPPPNKETTARSLEENKLHLWRVQHLFGSEELSSMSPSVADMIPAAYLEMNPEDAQARGFKADEQADLSKELGVTGILRLNPDLARGTVAVPNLATPRKVAAVVEVIA